MNTYKRNRFLPDIISYGDTGRGARPIAAYCRDYILVSSGLDGDAMAVFRLLAASQTS